MPARGNESNKPFDDRYRDRAIQLLAQALEILDGHDETPEVGARLQEVIDSLTTARYRHQGR